MNSLLKELAAKARAETTVPFQGQFEDRLAKLIVEACKAECHKVRNEENPDMTPAFLDGISSGAKRCETYIEMLFK